MDLLLFIIMILLIFVMYSVISSVQSLIYEMREVKNKCIKINNVPIEEFKVTTENPVETMTNNLAKLKSIFGRI